MGNWEEYNTREAHSSGGIKQSLLLLQLFRFTVLHLAIECDCKQKHHPRFVKKNPTINQHLINLFVKSPHCCSCRAVVIEPRTKFITYMPMLCWHYVVSLFLTTHACLIKVYNYNFSSQSNKSLPIPFKTLLIAH